MDPPDDGFFAVLRTEPEDPRLADPDASPDLGGARRGNRHSKLRQMLFQQVLFAGLNRLPDAEVADAKEWSGRIRQAARRFEIAPGRPLDGLIFPWRRMWQKGRVDDRMRAVAKSWLEGHRPQGFACGAVWGVDDHGVTGGRRGTRLVVAARVTRPVIGASPFSPDRSRSRRHSGLAGRTCTAGRWPVGSRRHVTIRCRRKGAPKACQKARRPDKNHISWAVERFGRNLQEICDPNARFA